MINRNKTIMRFIAVTMCTSFLNTAIIPAVEININGDTQLNENSSEAENLDDSNIIGNTSDSINIENLVTSTTEAAIIVGTDTSTLSDYVTIGQAKNGTITLDESSSNETKGYLKYIIKPDEGYEIKDVIVDGQSVGISTYYEFKNLTQSGHTISAVFKEIEKHATGYIPEFVKVPYVYKADVNNNLPSAFGLDEATNDSSYNTTDKNFISSVKNQGNLGVCWTFSAIGTFESSLLKEKQITTPAATTYDFSENHMRYALSSDNGNALGFDRTNYGGGNFDMALAYLARGQMNGVVNESDDPYPNTYLASAKAVRNLTDISGKPVQSYYPTQVIRLGDLPSTATNTEKEARKDEIKNLIMTYGSVTLSYYSDPNEAYYKKNTSDGTESYYYPTATTGNTNHAVSIVGWDDNYSVDHFRTQPAHPGAFLVKNNWGDTWGQNGYFYISYDDANSCSGINAFKEIKNRDFFNNIYEYDTFGKSGTSGYGTHDAYYANVFNTKKSGLEKLSAISTYCNNPDSYIKLYVSTDGGITFSEKTASLGYTYDATKGYKIDEAGYYTFILDNPIELNCAKFAVAIEVQQAAQTNLIPLEIKNSQSSNTVVENGSYIGYNLDDLKNKITSITNNSYNYNTCIKAFTEDATLDKTALNSAITAANANKTTAVVSTNGADVDPANKWVTQSVMDAYTAAISAAQTVADNTSATQTQVNDAVTNLAAATTAFDGAKVAGTKVAAPDKSVLNSAITAANTNKTTAVVSTNGADVDPVNKWVTQSVMTVYTAAISAAQTVADNTSATQTQVNDAVTNLAAATTTFDGAKAAGTKVTAVDKTALQSLYNVNKDKTQGNYTTATWTTFATALNNANTVLANANATQHEVDTVKNNLQSAINGLAVITVDKGGLQTLHDAHKNDIQGNYTTATWTTFTTALNNANTVLANANATQSEVDTAKTNLESAITGLIMQSSGGSGGSGGGSGSSGGSGGGSGSAGGSGGSSSSVTTTTSSSSNTIADTVKSIITSNGTAAATKDSIAKAITTIGINNTVDETVAKEIVKEVAKVVTENIVTNLKAVVGEGVISSEAKEIATADGKTIAAVTNVTKDGKCEGAVITASANSTTATIPVGTVAGEVKAIYKYVPLLGKYMQLTDGVQITANAVTLPTQANVVYYAATTPLASTETVTQGWAQVNNNWYMVNKTGDVQTGWQKDSTGWAYLSPNNGVMQTGWNKQGETWYHLGSNGYMSTGWIKDNNTWYYLNSDGSMAHDTTIDGYHLRNDGAWVK